MESIHYGVGKHRARHYRHSRSPSLSRYDNWELRGDTIPNTLPYHSRRHEVQRPDTRTPQRSSQQHRRASEDLRTRDPMPRPSRRIARSVTATERSSRSRRRYDEDDEEGDRMRSRLRARSISSSRSTTTSRHSEAISPETPLRQVARRRSLARAKNTSRSSSISSSTEYTPSVSTQDERTERRPVRKHIEVVSEPEPAPSDGRRPPRRRQKIIYMDESDHAGIYEEPLPIRARERKSLSRPPARRHSDSRSSSQKRPPQVRLDEGKYVASAKRPSKPYRKYYGSESYSEKTPPRVRPHVTSSSHIASSHSLGSSSRRSSALDAFFGPLRPAPEKPTKLVNCVVCLDDLPSSKAPRLKCGHRICHGCLTRSFRLSIKDPAQMPPKCCTSDHIPLKHVDRLFDDHFKRTWNRKFAEFSTHNRIYCPKRSCGVWIKPGWIHERGGRKFAKCGRCDTKICCACNGKWHESRKCPRDEETRQILQQAKELGWQRCFSCQALVELTEGCNHMTCRCGSQFCMICGSKWKTCECPWFSYDRIDQDPLDHMQVPSPVPDRERLDTSDGISPRDFQTGRGPLAGARPRRLTYEEDLYRRRLQEQEDEEYARRLQYGEPDGDGYMSDYGDDGGLANTGSRFVDETYRRGSQSLVQPSPPPPAPPMTPFERSNSVANYVSGVKRARGLRGTSIDRLADRFSEQRQGGSPIHRSFGNPIAHAGSPAMAMGPPPLPAAAGPLLMRHHTMDDEIFSSPRGMRASERMVPRRATLDYMDEGGVYAPQGQGQGRRRYQEWDREREREPPKDSVLAGLTGPGRGLNRVVEWSKHVEPGLPDNHTTTAAT